MLLLMLCVGLAVAEKANFETYTFPPVKPNFEFKLPTDPPPVDCYHNGANNSNLYFSVSATFEDCEHEYIDKKPVIKKCATFYKKCKNGCLIAKLNDEKVYRQGCRRNDAMDGSIAMNHNNGFGPKLLFHSCRTDMCNTKEIIDKYEKRFYPVPEITDPVTMTTTTSTTVSTTRSTTTSTTTTTSTSPPMTTTMTSTTPSSTASTTEKILPTEAMIRGSATTCALNFAILTFALYV